MRLCHRDVQGLVGIFNPGLLPSEAGQSPSGGGEEGSSCPWAPHAHIKPQATPPHCLGSLALGQPCAEAVKRDVPLAEGGVGHWALGPGPDSSPWLPPLGLEGAED